MKRLRNPSAPNSNQMDCLAMMGPHIAVGVFCSILNPSGISGIAKTKASGVIHKMTQAKKITVTVAFLSFTRESGHLSNLPTLENQSKSQILHVTQINNSASLVQSNTLGIATMLYMTSRDRGRQFAVNLSSSTRRESTQCGGLQNPVTSMTPCTTAPKSTQGPQTHKYR